MEIEAKYKITGPLDPEMISALDLAPYSLRQGQRHAHHDLLLDTPERAITGTHHSLRLRDENGAKILTFKGPGEVEGSVHRREEVEAPLPTNGAAEVTANRAQVYDYSTWPKNVAQRVTALVGPSADLQPLIELFVNRQTWAVERDGESIGELALDEGTILAHGASVPVHELELELKDAGQPSDLAALDERLCASLPLAPEPRSKLERGLALLNGTSANGTSGTSAVAGKTHGGLQPRVSQTQAQPDDHSEETKDKPKDKSKGSSDGKSEEKSLQMTGHTPLQLAARQAAAEYLEKIRKHEPKAREGHDSDAVHDMRVATRRLRSALDLLEAAPTFDAKRLHALRKHLRKLSHALGGVRDLDVFLKRLEKYEGEHPDAAGGLRPLRRTLEHQHKSARRNLVRTLDSGKLRRTLDQVETFATETAETFGDPRPVLVRHFAPSALWGRYEDVLRFESEVADAPERELHQLRIACKRARYAVEFFETALGEGSKEIETALIDVQDHLGELQDCVVALATIERIRRDQQSGISHSEDTALSDYAFDLAQRRDHLRETFTPLWERISGHMFREQLASLLAGL